MFKCYFNSLILTEYAPLGARLTAILGVLTLFGCQPITPAAPSCRIKSSISTEALSSDASAAACLIRLEDTVLLVRHRLSGRLDLPAGGVEVDESLRCTAHRETWEETGFNVEVGELLTYTTSGMPIFNCRGEETLNTLQTIVEAPYWATIEVTHLERIKPFELNADQLRFKDDLVPVRDAYVLAGPPR